MSIGIARLRTEEVTTRCGHEPGGHSELHLGWDFIDSSEVVTLFRCQVIRVNSEPMSDTAGNSVSLLLCCTAVRVNGCRSPWERTGVSLFVGACQWTAGVSSLGVSTSPSVNGCWVGNRLSSENWVEGCGFNRSAAPRDTAWGERNAWRRTPLTAADTSSWGMSALALGGAPRYGVLSTTSPLRWMCKDRTEKEGVLKCWKGERSKNVWTSKLSEFLLVFTLPQSQRLNLQYGVLRLVWNNSDTPNTNLTDTSCTYN